MATIPGTGEPVKPQSYKTWVLKVSIHCEGCKKKVRKVLHSVQGVYSTDIDTKLQKVIVTGEVEAETLINKLIKSGKNAELWPLTAEKRDRTRGGSKKREKQKDLKHRAVDQGEDHKEPEKVKATFEVENPPEPSKKAEGNLAQAPKTGENSGGAVQNNGDVEKSGGNSSGAVGKGEDSCASVKIVDHGVKNSHSGEAEEAKAEGKKLVTGCRAEQSPAAEIKAGECQPSIDAAGSKKKKGQKGPIEGGPSNVGAPASTESAHENSVPLSADPSHPHHGQYQYPTHYRAPPPVYAVSYNTAHPTSSFTASYYSSLPSHSYAYVHAGPETQPPPSNVDSYLHPLDSFELFSDENPNGCSVM